MRHRRSRTRRRRSAATGAEPRAARSSADGCGSAQRRIEPARHPGREAGTAQVTPISDLSPSPAPVRMGGARLPPDLATERRPRITGDLSGPGRPITGPDDCPCQESERFGEPHAPFLLRRAQHLPAPAEMPRELDVRGLAGLLAGVPLRVMMCHCAPLHSAGYGRIADGIGPDLAVCRTACTPDFRWSTRPHENRCGAGMPAGPGCVAPRVLVPSAWCQSPMRPL